MLAEAFNDKVMITRSSPKATFAFGFNASDDWMMATTTLLTSTTTGGFMQRGGADIYCAVMPTGPSGRQDGEGGRSFAYGGGGPPPEEPSQPHSGGGYGGPLNGPPGGGGGGGPGDSGGGGANPNPLLHAGLQAPFANGGLKGTAPIIFNGNRKNTKQFMQEFTLYRMINQDSITMRIAYTRIALALSFI